MSTRATPQQDSAASLTWKDLEHTQREADNEPVTIRALGFFLPRLKEGRPHPGPPPTLGEGEGYGVRFSIRTGAEAGFTLPHERLLFPLTAAH